MNHNKTITHKKRIPELDIMKGMAILCVVIGHYWQLPYIDTIIWSFHMPLFVFLSGYFFNPYKEGLIKKSAKAYLKPYCIVWFLILCFECAVALLWAHSDVTACIEKRLISGICALASNSTLHRPDWIIKIGVIWFLNALFLSICYARLLFKISSQWLQVAVIALFYLAMSYLTNVTLVPFGLNYASAFLIWIWLGYNFRQHSASRFCNFLFSTKGCVICSFIWGVVLIAEQLTANQFNICWLRLPLYGSELIGAFCAIIVVWQVSKLIHNHAALLSNVLLYIGTRTLWILCVHAFSLECLPITNGYIHSVFDVLVALSICGLYNKSIRSDV